MGLERTGTVRIGMERIGVDRHGAEALTLAICDLFIYLHLRNIKAASQDMARTGVEGFGLDRIGKDWNGLDRSGKARTGMDWHGAEALTSAVFHDA